MKLFGREPALWLELIKAVVVGAATIIPDFGGDQQRATLVIAAALFGLLTALTTHPPQLVAITETIQTVGIAVAAFAIAIPADMLSAIVLISGTLVTLLQHTQIAPRETAVSSA
jgi:hypothetical protein